jgi:YD repeat-containing protein
MRVLKQISLWLIGLFILFTISHKLYVYFQIITQKEILILEHNGTLYKYDEAYNLIEAKMEDKTITYEYNSNGTRKNKKINGEVIESYKWYGFNQLLSILDKNNKVIITFIYKHKKDLYPSALRKFGKEYLMMYDNAKNLRIVHKNGHILKTINYDKSGNVVQDSNPIFKTYLGFANGLYDYDTKLLHYHEGEYAPNLNQWLIKRHQINRIQNLQELATTNPSDVYYCEGTYNIYPHAFICTGYQCGGFYAQDFSDLFKSKGIVRDDALLFSNDTCKVIKSKSKYFASCVKKEIELHKEDEFTLFLHGCFVKANNIIKKCQGE